MSSNGNVTSTNQKVGNVLFASILHSSISHFGLTFCATDSCFRASLSHIAVCAGINIYEDRVIIPWGYNSDCNS